MNESRALLATSENCSASEKASGLPPAFFAMRALSRRAAGRSELQSYDYESIRGGEKAIVRLLLLALAALLISASLAAPSLGAQSGATNANSGEEFFIISSVDIAKGQLLVKQPTEITELLQANDKTRYTDKNGKAMQLADLRAGDTVYVRLTGTAAKKVAVSIRKAPMSVEELHRRYLK